MIILRLRLAVIFIQKSVTFYWSHCLSRHLRFSSEYLLIRIIQKMSAFDEQNEEMEVLNSIYPTEIEVLSQSPHKFQLTINPNPGGEENYGNIDVMKMTAVLIRFHSQFQLHCLASFPMIIPLLLRRYWE